MQIFLLLNTIHALVIDHDLMNNNSDLVFLFYVHKMLIKGNPLVSITIPENQRGGESGLYMTLKNVKLLKSFFTCDAISKYKMRSL